MSQRPISQCMTPSPATIASDATIADAKTTMREQGVRHLPVVESGRICGIVSRGDFKGMEIDRLDDEIHIWECLR